MNLYRLSGKMDYPSPDVEELNLPENKGFIAYLSGEIDGFLKTNGNSNTIMLFPPFNSYKRMLLHHLVESSYNNCGLSTFSIGQEPRRRTVVCLGSLRKNVLDDDASEPKNHRNRPRITASEEFKTPVRNVPAKSAETSEKPPERQRKARKTISYYVPPHLRKSSLESEPVLKKDRKDDVSDDVVPPTDGNSPENSQENAKTLPTPVETIAKIASPVVKKVIKLENSDVNLNSDWDPLYCGKGTCSVPNLVIPILDDNEMGDISKEVGQVRIVEIVGPNLEEEAESSEYVNGSMIEIYNLDDVKTDDLAQIFGDYVGRGFRLRWIDNGHALGIFASSKTAEEALSGQFSRIKIRPISQGTSLSQEIARNVVLPSSFRPKTCSSLAKRLLSGALGLKVSPLSLEERAAQKERLKENKDLRKKLAPL